MGLTTTGLALLQQIAQGTQSIRALAAALHKNKAQIYRTIAALIKKGFLKGTQEGKVQIASNVHTALLLQLLAQHPGIIIPFSGSGIHLLTTILQPRTVTEICALTNLQRSIVYRKLKQGRFIQIIRKKNNTYVVNEKIWSLAKQFFHELQFYESFIDSRVPANAVIYHKNDSEIIFSLPGEFDAVPTAFSTYSNYGIKLLTNTNFYYLPKKSLMEKDIFLHSLHIAEKERSIRYYIYVALFYLKYRKKISSIKNHLLDSLLEVLKGKVIPGFPKVEEIKEKAGIYDIPV